MTGPEPGDLAEIQCCSSTVTNCYWDGLVWRSFSGHRTILAGHVQAIRPLSVVPADSLEARIRESLERELPPGCRGHALAVAAAVRSAITTKEET